MDERAQGAGVDERAQLGELGAVGAHEQEVEARAGLALGGAAAARDEPDGGADPRGHRRAREREVGHAAHADDDATRATPRQRVELGVAAERVEHHVEVARGDRALRVVEDLIGAERAHQLDVLGAGGREDLGAEVLGELDRERADAASAGVDQHALPGLHRGDLAQRLQRGEPGERQRRGLGKADAGRAARDHALVGAHLLGEPAHAIFLEARAHLVADLPCADLGADRGDHAGDVAAEDDRQRRTADELHLAVAELEVDGVQAGGAHRDRDVARARHRGGDVLERGDAGATEAMHHVGAHGRTLRRCDGADQRDGAASGARSAVQVVAAT